MKILIFCDGGFGNRMNCLLGGLLLSKMLNRKPVIIWPNNDYCGASINDIYDLDYQILNIGINELFEKNINSVFFIHTNQTKLKIRQLAVNQQNLEIIKNCLEENIIYYNDMIPFFKNNEIISMLSTLKIKKCILDKISSYCLQNNVDKNTIGIHLRRTDLGSKITDNKFVEKIIKDNLQKNVFICSDDKNTEDLFQNQFPNVLVHKKTKYVEKKNNNLEWLGKVTDDQGRTHNYNVNRPRESVLEAIIDLLILSRTSICLGLVNSTFLNIAKLYSEIDIFSNI